jgi:hypothetical protein
MPRNKKYRYKNFSHSAAGVRMTLRFQTNIIILRKIPNTTGATLKNHTWFSLIRHTIKDQGNECSYHASTKLIDFYRKSHRDVRNNAKFICIIANDCR